MARISKRDSQRMVNHVRKAWEIEPDNMENLERL